MLLIHPTAFVNIYITTICLHYNIIVYVLEIVIRQ
jgi:hypothetical protein